MIEGILTDVFVKTSSDMVVVETTAEGTEVTLAAKLAEILAEVALKANKTDVTTEINAAIAGLIDGAPETMDTLKEVSEALKANDDVVSALNDAIGNKADKTTVEALQTALTALQGTVDGLGALAAKDKVSESDLDAELKEKVNAAAEGNHSHANKELLDGITSDQVTGWDDAAKKAHEHANKEELDKIVSGDKAKWDAAEQKAHEHENKEVLDGINADKVAAWDKAEENAIDTVSVNGTKAAIDENKNVDITVPVVYAQATTPANMKAGDLLLKIVE